MLFGPLHHEHWLGDSLAEPRVNVAGDGVFWSTCQIKRGRGNGQERDWRSPDMRPAARTRRTTMPEKKILSPTSSLGRKAWLPHRILAPTRLHRLCLLSLPHAREPSRSNLPSCQQQRCSLCKLPHHVPDMTTLAGNCTWAGRHVV